VAKFDRNDKFLMDWGSAPKNPSQPGPSEFNTPHSIAISADRRVFVVDRGHQRMQVFDENGKFLDMWPLRSPTWPAAGSRSSRRKPTQIPQSLWDRSCALRAADVDSTDRGHRIS
jgi:hypothetical protein